jgi:hypothetical protein
LLRLLLKITPAEASYLMIWVAVSAFVGRMVCMWMPDLIRRRTSGMLTCLGGVATLIIAGYLADAYIGTVSVFWLMLMEHSFFGGGSYTIIAPYMAEVWPAGLRASGMGLGWQPRQDHQPARTGADRRRDERYQAGGVGQRDDPGNVLPRLLGGAGGCCVCGARHRDQRPLDRGDRRRARQARIVT